MKVSHLLRIVFCLALLGFTVPHLFASPTARSLSPDRVTVDHGDTPLGVGGVDAIARTRGNGLDYTIFSVSGHHRPNRNFTSRP